MAKPKRQPPRVKLKACPEHGRRNDPKLAAARGTQLARYLEQFNAGLVAEDEVLPAAKYAVCKTLNSAPMLRNLPAA